MRLVALAAAAAALALCAAQASAQLPILSPADQKAILCIFDSFNADEKLAVAVGEINGDDKSAADQVKAILKGAAACKGILGGDQRRIDLAGRVAIEEAIIDVAVSQLKSDGMTSDAGAIYDVWRSLSARDQAYFLDEKAPDDEPFRARMRPLLFRAGLPNNEPDVDGGMLIMECLANIAEYYRLWQKLDADTTH